MFLQKQLVKKKFCCFFFNDRYLIHVSYELLSSSSGCSFVLWTLIRQPLKTAVFLLSQPVKSWLQIIYLAEVESRSDWIGWWRRKESASLKRWESVRSVFLNLCRKWAVNDPSSDRMWLICFCFRDRRRSDSRPDELSHEISCPVGLILSDWSGEFTLCHNETPHLSFTAACERIAAVDYRTTLVGTKLISCIRY